MTVHLDIDMAGFRFLADRMGRVPPEALRQIRPRLRAAGEKIRAAAASNAGWSSRIPGSLTVRVATAGGSRQGVYVAARQAMAPHARPYEAMDGRNPFSHPVFGYGNAWVRQAARPYLAPAARSQEGTVKTEMEAAIAAAEKAAGL